MNKSKLSTIARAGVLSAAVSLLSAGAASAAGLANPTVNRTLSGTTLTACMSNPSGADCTNATLADINAARAAEGVRPMVLPGNYSSLTAPQQLLVLANLERGDRGLKVLVVGLAADLNRNAATAAAADQDPSASPWNGDSMSSNWAGGYDTPLEADFSWMYDDGIGSPNQDCNTGNTSGCWGHRMDILMTFDPPLMMGAAVGNGQYGTSMAELFVGGDTAAGPGQDDAPVGQTYAQLMGLPSGSAPAAGSDTGSGSSNPSAGGGSGSAPSTAAGSTPGSAAGANGPSSSTQPTARAAAQSVSHPDKPVAHETVCTVPLLRGMPLARAIRALVQAHCGVGQVISMRATIASVRHGVRAHRRHRRLHVIVQSVRAGSHRHAGFRVTLRVR